MKSFADFIEKSRLVDIPCRGKKFSWYSGDGKSMSRIDRFLMSDSIVNNRGVVGQLIGNRDISDHCPIWIVKDNVNWGPKPFKFNEWFSFESFVPFVEKKWKDFKVEGKGDFVLKDKFRLLKERLKWWNKEVFGRIDLELEEGVRDINIGDERLDYEDDVLHPEIIAKGKEDTSRFWTNLRIKENMLVQKSRLKWLNEGDSNSGFFHKVMKERRRHNHTGPVMSSSGLLESVEEIKEEVTYQFSNKFIKTDGEASVGQDSF
ncbi:unnamed protein product [Vicia faba]|uniref:Cysteine-rich receptor-like protein kinase n=1 Tax=Vicia faba TaxID=3906 RepID=A0AAV1A308_VICFA|nr:unnamed protein product [Vicia faba]